MADAVRRSPEEIREQADSTGDAGVGFGASKWPGMSYEQGVSNALRWVLGDEETAPMEDE